MEIQQGEKIALRKDFIPPEQLPPTEDISDNPEAQAIHEMQKGVRDEFLKTL